MNNMLLLILIFTLEFLLFFFVIRGINRLYTDSALKKRQRKKLKYTKFIDWFLYKQHYDILPKTRLIWYFSVIAEYCILIIIVIVFRFELYSEISRNLVCSFFLLNALLLLGAEIGVF